MLLSKAKIIGTLIKYLPHLVIILVIGYKFYSLDSEVKDLESQVKEYKSLVEKRDGSIVALKLEKKISESNYNQCKKNISQQNEAIDILAKDYSESMKALELWMNKPPIIKYEKVYEKIVDTNIDYDKATCDEGLNLNKSISEHMEDVLKDIYKD